MKPTFQYSNQLDMFGVKACVGYGSPDFWIEEIHRDKANAMIVANHYSKKFYSASYIHLGVFVGGEMIGVLQYGYAMNPASQSGVVANTGIDEYLELNRMWIDDKAGRNSESRAIAYTIKYIRQAFPKVKWIQSFADERCGRWGVVYQACSFEYVGEHTATFWEYGDEWFHNSLMTRAPHLSRAAAFIQANRDGAKAVELRQFRYIKFLHNGSRKHLKLKRCKYPKHYAVEGSTESRLATSEEGEGRFLDTAQAQKVVL
jgi:hypothetical protein